MKQLIVALGFVIISNMAWADSPAVLSSDATNDLSLPRSAEMMAPSLSVEPATANEVMYSAGRTAESTRSSRLERAGRLSRSAAAAEVKAN